MIVLTISSIAQDPRHPLSQINPIDEDLNLEGKDIENISELRMFKQGGNGLLIKDYTISGEGEAQRFVLDYQNDVWSVENSDLELNGNNISGLGYLDGFFDSACSSGEAVVGIQDDGSVQCESISGSGDGVVENLSETLTAGNIANQTIEFNSTTGIRIGNNNTTTNYSEDIAIGRGANADGWEGDRGEEQYGVAIGEDAGANTRSSIAIGTRANVSGHRGIAIGGGEYGSAGARAIGRESIAIGTRNRFDNLGHKSAATAIGVGSVAIGSSAIAPNDYEVTFGNLQGRELDVNITGGATIHEDLDFFEGRCPEGVVEQVNDDGTYDCGAPALEEVLNRGNVAGKGIKFEGGVELGDSETSTGKEWLTSLKSIIYDTARQWREGGAAEADTDIGGNVSIALQSASQSLDWESSVDEDVNSIIVENGTVTFTADDRLFAGPLVRSLDVSDGSQNWQYTGHSSDTFGLAVDGDVAYSGDDDGDVVAYDGSQETVIFNNRYHDNAVYAMDFEDGILYTASYDNTVKAYDVDQERVLWSHERHSGDVLGVKVKDGVVYSGSIYGKMIAYDGEEQEVLWSHAEHYGNSINSLAIEEDLLISGGSGGKVAAYSIEDREKVWSHEKHNSSVYGVDIDDGVVVSSSDNTTVKAYHAYEEELLWSHNRHNQGSPGYELYDVGIGGEDVVSGGDTLLDGVINVDSSISFASNGGYNSDTLATRSGDELWGAELESSLNGQSGTFRLNVSNQSNMSSSVSESWSLQEGLDEVRADARGEFAQFDIDLNSDGTDTPRVFKTKLTYGNPAQQGRDQIAIGKGANTTEPGSVGIGGNASATASGAVSLGYNSIAPNKYEATLGNLNGEELDLNVTGNATIHENLEVNGRIDQQNVRDVSYSSGHTSWASGLSTEEVNRFGTTSTESVEVERLDVQLKGGGTNSNFEVEVYDAGSGTVLGSTTAGTPINDVGITSEGGDLTIRITNSAGSDVVASITVTGQVVE